ncbi:hypothetical protein BS47DRAFT_1330805, partial [Hydnum rufescens UP504]
MGHELDGIDSDEEDPNGTRVLTAVRYDPALIRDENRNWRSTMSSGAARSPLLLLPYHQDRLVAAATALGWENAARIWNGADALARLVRKCEEAVREVHPMRSSPGDKTAFKIRCILRPSGKMTMEVTQIGRRPFDLLGAPYMTPAYLVPLTPNTLMTWPTAYAPIISVFLDTAPTFIKALGDSTRHKTTRRDRFDAARERAGITSPGAPEEVMLYNEDNEVIEGSTRNVTVWRDGWVTPPLSSGCMDGTVRRWMLQSGKVREARITKDELIPGEWVLTCNAVEGCSFGKFFPGRGAHYADSPHMRLHHPTSLS